MIKRNLLASVAAMGFLVPPALSATSVHDRSIEVTGVGAAADPLLAIETNRSAIVERLVVEHRATLFANGIAESSFRNALYALRADRLLAASLVRDFAAITAIVDEAVVNGSASRRFVAITPASASQLQGVPAAAEAYLLRDGDRLRIVESSELHLAHADTQIVGYFVSSASVVIMSAGDSAFGVKPKDGSGSGANSWIGYVAGSNVASGSGSAVAAGRFNTASGQNAFVAAGQSNVASGISSLVIGGFDNQATVIDAMVGAGAGNRATGARSVVVGGGYNLASGQWSFIGGGGRQTGSGVAGATTQDHIASGDFSAIVGGQGNRATGARSFVGGGEVNAASNIAATVAGGSVNTASGAYSTIGGGVTNVASGSSSTVAGGNFNAASNPNATVGGGSLNRATGSFSTVAGGDGNTASNTWATVAGGLANTASGSYSFVVGATGHANFNGCAILAFWSTTTTFNCLGLSNVVRVGANHGFSVDYFSQRADGGGNRWVYVGDTIAGQTIGTWTGAYLTDGGVWTNASDRDLKEDFTPVEARAVLRRVASMPIQRWRYKGEAPGVMHIGPVAQDFHAAFGLGDSDKGIGTVDADGVALAAIQGLYQEVQERDARIALQQQRIATLEQQFAEMQAAQLQLMDMAQLVLKLQQEIALAREARAIALAR